MELFSSQLSLFFVMPFDSMDEKIPTSKNRYSRSGNMFCLKYMNTHMIACYHVMEFLSLNVANVKESFSKTCFFYIYWIYRSSQFILG